MFLRELLLSGVCFPASGEGSSLAAPVQRMGMIAPAEMRRKQGDMAVFCLMSYFDGFSGVLPA
ncbi:MAG: hypothetical protein Q4D19_00210 [Lautropia sp.]|nr:hypothetical protein [Lautropia sp.]